MHSYTYSLYRPDPEAEFDLEISYDYEPPIADTRECPGMAEHICFECTLNGQPFEPTDEEEKEILEHLRDMIHREIRDAKYDY